MRSIAIIFLAFCCVSINGQQYYNLRHPRSSAGAYSGVSNGQYYGGTYQAPDNGPAIFNRFGDHPPVVNPGPNTFANQPNFVPPFQNPIEFNNFFQSYFKQLNDNLAFSSRSGIPHHSSSSHSTFSFSDPSHDGTFAKNFENQQAAFDAAQKAFQAAAHNQFGPEFPFAGPSYTSSNIGNRFGGGAASASASFGPGGGHQTASIYPPNPSHPNIENRFGGNGPSPGGNFGVSTSSFAGTSDVNGKKTSIKQATTTINDNGKVTTYTVKN